MLVDFCFHRALEGESMNLLIFQHRMIQMLDVQELLPTALRTAGTFNDFHNQTFDLKVTSGMMCIVNVWPVCCKSERFTTDELDDE